MSDVVTLEYPTAEIAVITMADDAAKNTMSPEIVSGLQQAFAEVNDKPDIKVVITTGFGNYYSCGGTLAELEELNRGERTYADLPFFTLPLECKVPTIAIVQGHAIGGGLAFACLHDFMFLTHGSAYGANFMKYGFTPGMCSTYMIPKRFGEIIGKQMLFSAVIYRAKELIAMNCPIPFYPKDEVTKVGMEFAEQLADKTLTSLQLLKKHMNRELETAIPEVIELEVAMHAQTITTPEALERIKKLFGE